MPRSGYGFTTKSGHIKLTEENFPLTSTFTVVKNWKITVQ